MNSVLKNSLYLGASALMLLSVGAPAVQQFSSSIGSEVTANASHRHVRHHAHRHSHRAKVYTRSVINLPYQQPVTRTVTGRSAMYNKPADLKGAHVVASQRLMHSFAKDRTFSHYVMAYRKALTNHGTYYKVVSYNFQLRGWVPAKTLRSARTSHKVRFDNAHPVYFNSPRTTSTHVYPIRSLIYNPIVSKGVRREAKDPLRITAARCTYRGGVKSLYVYDRRNPSVNGWVKASQVSDRPSVRSGGYFDRKSEVRVNFEHNGTVVKRALLPAGTNKEGVNVTSRLTESNGPLSNSAWADDELAGTKYGVDMNERSNQDALHHIKSGDTVTLNTYRSDHASSKLLLHVDPSASNKGDMTIGYDGQVGSDHVNFPRYFNRSELNALDGNSKDPIDLDSVESNFFNNGSNMSELDGSATYYRDASGNEVFVPRSDIDNVKGSHKLYHYVYKYDSSRTRASNHGRDYGSIIDAYYHPVQVSGAAPESSSIQMPKNAKRALAGILETISSGY